MIDWHSVEPEKLYPLAFAYFQCPVVRWLVERFLVHLYAPVFLQGAVEMCLSKGDLYVTHELVFLG